MKIGCLGDIAFEVSDRRVQTIENASWSGSVQLTEHKRHLTDALVEYTGRNADTFSFDVKLSAWLGVNPWDALLKIWDYERNATPLPLIIGEKAYGKYKWLIKSHKVKLEETDGSGNLLSCTVSVSLIEYTRR